MGGPEYFKQWYEKNREEVARKRSKLYHTNKKYRNRVRQRNKRYYDAIKNGKVSRKPVVTEGNDNYYSMAQVAQIIGVSPNTLNKALKQLGIKPRRVGKYATLNNQQIQEITQWQRK